MKVLLLILMLLSTSLVSAELFMYYEENVFTVRKVFNPELHEAIFFSPFANLQWPMQILEKIDLVENIVKEGRPDVGLIDAKLIGKTSDGFIGVRVTKEGFDPQVIKISVGDQVTWINKRDRLSALIIGVREISSMKSSFMSSGDIFSYTFDEIGEYTYVDGVVIGVTGRIVVN